MGAAARLDYNDGYQISAVKPFRVRIDYGDGRTYENDNGHLALVFSHRYRSLGRHVVTAILTDAQGETARGTCRADWALPTAPAGHPAWAPRFGGLVRGALQRRHNDELGWNPGRLLIAQRSIERFECSSQWPTGSGSTYLRSYVRSNGTYAHG